MEIEVTQEDIARMLRGDYITLMGKLLPRMEQDREPVGTVRKEAVRNAI